MAVRENQTYRKISHGPVASLGSGCCAGSLMTRNDTQRMLLRTVAIVIEIKGNPCARKWNAMLIGGTSDMETKSAVRADGFLESSPNSASTSSAALSGASNAWVM